MNAWTQTVTAKVLGISRNILRTYLMRLSILPRRDFGKHDAAAPATEGA